MMIFSQPPEVIVAKSSKSILKNPKTRPQITKTPPAKLQIPQKTSPAKPRLSRPPSRSTTPVNRAVKQKTVAFGLTTNLSDTVEVIFYWILLLEEEVLVYQGLRGPSLQFEQTNEKCLCISKQSIMQADLFPLLAN